MPFTNQGMTMNHRQSRNPHADTDLKALSLLPTVQAVEFADWQDLETGLDQPSCQRKKSLFDSDQEFRLCKAVVGHPLQKSSRYPKLAGISAKTAQPLRHALVAKGYIREHTMNSGRRGRNTILLEALPAGANAVAHDESQKE